MLLMVGLAEGVRVRVGVGTSKSRSISSEEKGEVGQGMVEELTIVECDTVDLVWLLVCQGLCMQLARVEPKQNRSDVVSDILLE